MCVLDLVRRRDMYGFEVIETLSKSIDVNENTIYPILRRLTQQGYFSIRTEATSLGAPRKYFCITNKGKERLEECRHEWDEFLQGVFRILKEGEGK